MHFSLVTKITYQSILNIFLYVYLSVISSNIYGLNNNFYHLGLKDGLSSNRVMSIVQDHQGFMWFTTEDGLNRFDGYEIEVYQHDVNDPQSISDNMLKKLFVDKKGRLWIGTDSGGLDLYNPVTKTFSHFRFPLKGSKNLISNGIHAIVEDKQGILWLGTQDVGLIRFDEKNNSYQHYLPDDKDKSSISHNNVRTIFEDSHGRLWIGTVGGGLNLFHRDENSFEHYRFKNDNPLSLSNDIVRSIVEDYRGRLWVATLKGLNRLDPNKKTFTRYYHTQENDSLSSSIINHINSDSKQQLWISTDDGLNIYNEDGDNFIRFQYNDRLSDGLSDKSIITSYEGANGNIWIGTRGGGINRYSPKNQYFKHIRHEPGNENSLLGNSVYAIYQDKKDRLWIGTVDGGLNQYNPLTKQFSHYRHDPGNPGSISGNRVGNIFQDSKGIFWIGTYDKGLNRFDEKTGIFQRFLHDERNENSLSDNAVISMLEDYQGILWIGTNFGGLNRFDPSTQTFKHFLHDPNDKSSISFNRVWVIHEDKNNNLWIGMEAGGLNYYDRKNDQFVRYGNSIDDSNSISNNGVTTIHETTSNGLWVGTNYGLNYFDFSTKIFTRYYQQDGLPSDLIYSIEDDREGNLWLSTSKGLSRFNPDTKVFKNYDIDDGLLSNEFNGNTSMKANNGELYFGASNGITSFDPWRLQVDMQAPKVAIIRFLLFNKPVSIVRETTSNRQSDQTFLLEKAIGATSDLTLTHHESLFAFDFVALHYSNPRKNEYAYQLEGWDQDWIITDHKNRRATYTNIPSGDYIFRVKASNGDGVWNEKGTSIRISILPPPWKTWWAYSLYALLLVLLIAVMFLVVLERHQIQRKQRELQREREHSKRLSQLDKLKDDFLANTSHELRTPLNGIIGLTEGLLDYEAGSLTDNVKNHLYTVIHSGRRLAHLINDILDFSKLKNKSIELHIKSIDVCTLTDVVVTLIRPLVGDKDIQLVNNIDKDMAVVNADENRLQQILYNLIGNAIKFTHQGEIEIYSQKSAEKIFISVKDSGIGIPSDKLESIFQSFEQAGGSVEREYGGTGIGLTVTKQLVELHSGEISVKSTLGVGSTFTFDLLASDEPAVGINTAVAATPIPTSTLAQTSISSSRTSIPTSISSPQASIPASIALRTPTPSKIIPFNRPTHVGSIIAEAANVDGVSRDKTLIKEDIQITSDYNFKILIVDDEEMNRLVICNYLRDHQYDLYEAVNGEEVLAVTEVMYFDLILLDVMMPKISGFEVCKKIREKYSPDEQAIIFLTAKTQADDVAEGFSLGVNDYLSKPIVKKELLVRVKTHLQLVYYFRTKDQIFYK